VRIPNPRLVRLGGLTRGAIVEPGDGELIISPLVQPVIELTSPLDVLYANAAVHPSASGGGAAGTQADDSFYIQNRSIQIGAVAGNSVILAIFAKGQWLFEINHVFQYSVAAQLDRRYGVFLADPALATAALLEAYTNGPLSGVLAHRRELRITFQRDNFALYHITSATAGAGDNVSSAVMVNARRIL
jgi:hypothetical protein